MKPHIASAFHFKRLNPKGPVQVLNHQSYVMGEYNQSTGTVSWQRFLLATQKKPTSKAGCCSTTRLARTRTSSDLKPD